MKKVALIAAAAVTMAPTFAAAADSVQALSIANAPVRAVAAKGKTQGVGGAGLLGVVALVAIGAGVFVLADNKDSSPDSK